jgi:crossover junction endodeoxyribonuclease RuvC
MSDAGLRILGIDPGLRHTGWGLVERAGTRLRHIANGEIAIPVKGSLAERLAQLLDALEALMGETRPDAAAVEQIFVNRDAAQSLKLGQARAIALVAPARAGIPVAEYAPNLVKKSVVGAGHADKAQIHFMVTRLLPGAEIGGEHAADALAVAITHAHWEGRVPTDPPRKGRRIKAARLGA